MADQEIRMQFREIACRFSDNAIKVSDPKMPVAGLNFYYGNNPALRNIDLDIERYNVTALIGPSGCGKSTFLRTLNRMNETISVTRMEGTVRLDGVDIYRGIKDVSTVRTRVGMVFQKS